MVDNVKDSWMVIVNPKAGLGYGLRDFPLLSNQLNRAGIVFSSVFTEKKYHAIELTVKAINDGYRKIVAVGGDGTVNEIVNGIFIQKVAKTTDISLAVIAVGNGNDWVRMFGIPKKYTEAIKAIAQGKTVLQDAALISYYESMIQHKRYMANVAGVGFDAMVNRKYNKLKDEGRKGRWLYMLSTLSTLLKSRSRKFDIKLDGVPFLSTEVFSGTIGIGKYNGGGMIQMPAAVFNDGLLDLTMIKKMHPLAALFRFNNLYNGRIYSLPQAVAAQGRVITLESDPETPVEVDGEALGYSPFTFELVPKCIRVVVTERFYVENQSLEKGLESA